MSDPAASTLSRIADTYHLWTFIIPILMLGTFELLSLSVYLYFRLLATVDDERMNYRRRRFENERRR